MCSVLLASQLNRDPVTVMGSGGSVLKEASAAQVKDAFGALSLEDQKKAMALQMIFGMNIGRRKKQVEHVEQKNRGR